MGDEVTVESATDKDLRRALVVLPDGTITLPLLGQVRAAHLTRAAVARSARRRSTSKYYKVPAITVTPTKVDTKLEDLRYTVGGRSGFGGQVRSGKVTPEGTVQLPAVGSVPAQGLTLDEFRQELAERFAEKIEGIEVVPVLTTRAPRYVYVLGEVKLPGRYTLDAADHGDAGPGHGRKLEQRCEHSPDRRLPSGRRLAADRHGARFAGRACSAAAPALAAKSGSAMPI